MEERIEPKVSIFHWLKQRVFLFRSPWKDIVQFILLIGSAPLDLVITGSGTAFPATCSELRMAVLLPAN